MELIQIAVLLSALLCSLVAGLVLTFAIVVMPGTKTLGNRDFLKAFKAMDRVIQDNQPIFMLVWLGSIVALIAATIFGMAQLDGIGRLLIIFATVAYLFGVQFSTITINIPLNNRIQSVDVETTNETQHKTVRGEFEPRWVRWNSIRSLVSSLVSVLLIIIVFREPFIV